MLELCVPVGIADAFQRLAIYLPAVLQRRKQLGDGARASQMEVHSISLFDRRNQSGLCGNRHSPGRLHA